MDQAKFPDVGSIIVGLIDQDQPERERVILHPRDTHSPVLLLPYAERFHPFGHEQQPVDKRDSIMLLEVTAPEGTALLVSEKRARITTLQRLLVKVRAMALTNSPGADPDGDDFFRPGISGYVIAKTTHRGAPALSMLIGDPWIGNGFEGIVPLSRLPGETQDEKQAFFDRVQPGPKRSGQASVVDLVEDDGVHRTLLTMRSTMTPHMLWFD